MMPTAPPEATPVVIAFVNDAKAYVGDDLLQSAERIGVEKWCRAICWEENSKGSVFE